jgi:hypothetical protein
VAVAGAGVRSTEGRESYKWPACFTACTVYHVKSEAGHAKELISGTDH